MKHNTNNSPTIASKLMRAFAVALILALMVSAVSFSQTAAPLVVTSTQSGFANPTAINLLTAGNFRILAGSAITIAASNTITGDIGVSPGTSVTNAGIVTGTTYTGVGSAAGQGQTDLTTAYNAAALPAADATVATELGGTNLGRGVYTSGAGTFSITGSTLTLTGTATDIFIFKMATTLTTDATSHVTLVGVLPSNVFWQVGSSATIDGDFKGVILAYTAITQNGGTLDGRALAQNSFVTVNGTALLPVELISFTAKANQTSADLRWSTATETNNYGFEIERRQTATWEKIGFVAGAGTSTSPRNYSYTDNNLSSGSYAYRIKQINKNGTFSYNGSAQVEIGSVAKKFELASNYPNPFNPSTTVQFTLENDGMATLTVYNMLGQKVMTLFDNNAQAGKLYQVKFDATDLPTGLYFAKLQSGNQRMIQKMALVK